MNVVVIPAKAPDRAKSRLGAALDPGRRRALADDLARRALEAALGCASADLVLVVTSDRDLARHAEGRGAVALVEESGPEGLNVALERAREVARGRDAAALAVLLADLPTVEPTDVDALFGALAGDDGAVVLARSRDGRGLGGLAVRPPGAIPFRFGDGEAYRAHLAAAGDRGLPVVTLDRPGLAFDLDTPDDLAELAARENGR